MRKREGKGKENNFIRGKDCEWKKLKYEKEKEEGVLNNLEKREVE